MNKPNITYNCIESEHAELIVTTAMEHCYPWHFHAQHTILGFVLAGTVVVKKQQKQQILASGGFFIIQPHEMHSLEVFSHSKLAVISFDSREQCYSDALKKNCADVYAAYNSKGNEFAVTEEQRIVIQEAQQFQAGIADMLIVKDKKIEQVCKVLLHSAERSLPVSLSTPQMAAIAGYSTWHFLRCFQANTGMTPHMFQTICRLRATRRLLRKDMTTVDVAMSTGFTDQSHLHKVFKLHYGLTPRQFLQATVMV